MVSEAISLATELVKLVAKLLDGSATPEEIRRVRDILPEKSESEKAAERIRRVTLGYSELMDKLVNDLDDPGEEPKS